MIRKKQEEPEYYRIYKPISFHFLSLTVAWGKMKNVTLTNVWKKLLNDLQQMTFENGDN